MASLTPGQEMRIRLDEWAQWYMYHIETIKKSEDLKQTTAFFAKALEGLLDLNGSAVQAILDLELGKEVKLLVPKGVKVSGDLRKVGG